MSFRVTAATIIALGYAGSLTGCVSAPSQTGSSLSMSEGLKDGRSGRARMQEKRDAAALSQVKKVHIVPARLQTAPDARYSLSPEEQTMVLGEVTAQLCFELSERYDIVTEKAQSDAYVQSAVTWFEPTGAAASGASAVAGVLIPGPIGLRLPGSLGGLGAEAEMLQTKGDTQIAAIVWARRAQSVGTDKPSLARLGDALQFAEPFADDAARVMSPEPLPAKRTYAADKDPCLQYGGRIDETGMVTSAITGLYNPKKRPSDDDDTKD